MNSLLQLARLTRLVEQGTVDGASVYTAQQLFTDLRRGIWSELTTPARPIDQFRRNVQRIHIDALDARLNGPTPPPEIRAILRGELRAVRAEIVRALPAVTDRLSRLHLEDARDQIDEVLDPRAMRASAGGRRPRRRCDHHRRRAELDVRLEQRSVPAQRRGVLAGLRNQLTRVGPTRLRHWCKLTDDRRSKGTSRSVQGADASPSNAASLVGPRRRRWSVQGGFAAGAKGIRRWSKPAYAGRCNDASQPVQKVRALATVLLVCLAAQAAQSQAPLTFEVASVRLHSEPPAIGPGAPIRGVEIRTEQFEANNYPLTSLITLAHGVVGGRLEGAPEWVRNENYDIRAKAPKPSSRQDMLQMLQTLLAERFQLKAHRETRTMDIYGLVLVKADNSLGPGMHPVKVDCETNTITEGPDPGLFPRDARPACGSTRVGITMVSGPVLLKNAYAAATMERFATGLSGSLGRPVFDRTGLTGTFDIELNYIREMPPGPGFSERPAGAPAPEGVSLRDALKQQLGLDLRSERGPVEYFVIDSISRPAAN